MELPRRTGARKPGRKPRPQLQGAQPPAPAERWIALGVVMGTHGVRGDLRVKLHNPESQLLFELEAVQLRAPGQAALDTKLRRYPLSQVRPGGKGLLMHLHGVDTVEQAQALRGQELCVARSQLPDLPEGEFYYCDLEGLPLVDLDGRQRGTIERVHEYPAASVLRVKSDQGVLEVPMREPYLVQIDLAAGRVVADQLDDLEPERA
ncbi:MAG TPA: ribosome maturation factor RimM [Polyangiales bacterium]|nr:ribosome maturation factor RimM [Polyangiales bacterium]